MSTVTKGFLNSRGELVVDKWENKNKDRFLLLIVADEDMIYLPEVLYKGGSVKVEPIMKRDGTMCATAVSLSKNHITDICVGTSTFRLEYDNGAEQLCITETTPVESREYDTQKSWWDKMKKNFKTCARRFFVPHYPWRT